MRSVLTKLATGALAGGLLMAGLSGTAGAATAASSGINDWSCQPSAAHPQPVVLLHGLGATSYEDTGMYLAPYLAAAGYCVFDLTYGATSPLGPFVGGLGDITASGVQIGSFVNQVLAATGASKVDLVGHSEGAFMSLWVPKVTGFAGKVASVVALAPPTHGTTFDNLVTAADLFGLGPAAQTLLNYFDCHACAELITGGSAVATLDNGPIAQPGVSYTVIASRTDELVTPTGTAFVEEPGVTNEYVQDFCPDDPVGHIGEAYDPDVAQMIANALDPATATAITCTFGAPF
jgi:pimeloyl-ACP methyl ester carboxylesterase